MKHLLIATAFAAMAATPALADEEWRTDTGIQILYDSDLASEGMAVLRLEGRPGVTMYVEGLAGVTEDRGTYSGIWFADESAQGEDGCSVAIVRPGPDGEPSKFWGQFEITFIDKGFPSIWFGSFGTCFDPLVDQLVARPVTG